MPMMWVFIIQWNNVLSYKSETFLYNHCTSVRNQFKFSQLIAVTLCSHSVTCCKCQWSLYFSVILLLNLLSLWRCLFVYCLSLTRKFHEHCSALVIWNIVPWSSVTTLAGKIVFHFLQFVSWALGSFLIISSLYQQRREETNSARRGRANWMKHWEPINIGLTNRNARQYYSWSHH